jgi:tetratricopeptide (TPR) repeat protein
MLTKEEIGVQHELLRIYRLRLSILLSQRDALAPGESLSRVRREIADNRERIRRTKAMLAAQGVAVEHAPHDDDDIPQRHSVVAALWGGIVSFIQVVASPWGGAVLFGGVVFLMTLLIGRSNMEYSFSESVPFAPAKNNESLIIVADFGDRSRGRYRGVDPAQYIYEHLSAQVLKDRLDIRVERLYEPLNDHTAKRLGRAYRATLVVWGWYDDFTITPRIERTGSVLGTLSNEETHHFRLSPSPEHVEFCIVTDLPAHVTYLMLVILGVDSYTRGSYDAALVYLTSALEAIPQEINHSTNPAEAYFYRGLAYLQKEEYDHAITDFHTTLSHRPDFEAVYASRGLAFREQGAYQRAIADFDVAIRYRPDDAHLYNERGLCLLALDEYEGALADFDRALSLDPTLATAYDNRGFVYRKQGDLDRAIADYTTAMNIQPTFANAYNNRGLAYAQKGDLDQAITDYTRAITLTPDRIDAYVNRGLAYTKKGEFDRAIADFDHVMHVNPHRADVYSHRGLAYAKKGAFEQAIADFNHAIHLDPNNAGYFIDRGTTYFLNNEHERALEDYDAASSLDPNESTIYYNRGLVYAKKGDMSYAIANYTRAVTLNPGVAETYYIRGLAYQEAQEPAHAIADFEMVLSMSKNPFLRQQAHDALEEVRGEAASPSSGAEPTE